MDKKVDYALLSWSGVAVNISERTYIQLEKIVPNPSQPRRGVKESEELRKNIEAIGDLINPILVEIHKDDPNKYMLIDGERRFSAYKTLYHDQGIEKFSTIPAQIIDRSLTVPERLRIWVSIHRQRKDWSAKERELVAYDLAATVGREEAGAILGYSLREVDKLIDIVEINKRMPTNLDASTKITYAREIRNFAGYMRDDSTITAIIKKIAAGYIKSSKEIRELKPILREPKAKKKFIEDGDTIKQAWNLIPSEEEEDEIMGSGLDEDIEILLEDFRTLPALQISELKKDKKFLKKLDECEAAIKKIKKLMIK